MEKDIYIQDYRHFDALIWQVPAWASAIFSFSITASVLALANSTEIEHAFGVHADIAVGVFSCSVFVVLILLSNVFLRFRLHQRTIYRPKRKSVPSLWFLIPGQTSLLLILFIESSVTLSMSLIAFGANVLCSLIFSLVFLIVGFLYVEWSVRKLSKIIKAARDPVGKESEVT